MTSEFPSGAIFKATRSNIAKKIIVSGKRIILSEGDMFNEKPQYGQEVGLTEILF
jgi:hypothetical protein